MAVKNKSALRRRFYRKAVEKFEAEIGSRYGVPFPDSPEFRKAYRKAIDEYLSKQDGRR